jgi:hypothetical protein
MSVYPPCQTRAVRNRGQDGSCDSNIDTEPFRFVVDLTNKPFLLCYHYETKQDRIATCWALRPLAG